MVRTGAEIVIECLKEQGVDVVFGYPGGSILNVYDALYKHSDEIFHVLTSHEQVLHMQQMAMRVQPEKSVCVWRPAVPARRIWLPALRPRTWIPFRW